MKTGLFGPWRTKAAGVLLAAAIAATIPTGTALAQTEKPAKAAEKKPLKVGDKAPVFKVETFVKGDAIAAFEPGKVYILDFWATWCGPCIKMIPHMTEVQKEYKDKNVRIVGVSIWEDSRPLKEGNSTYLDQVKAFVTAKGDAMGYTVAFGGVKGPMEKTWMEAAQQQGIPSVFIVDKEGKIGFIGHPADGMDEALAAIVAGKPVQRTDAQIKKDATKAKVAEFQTALAADDLTKAGAVAEQLVASDPNYGGTIGTVFKAHLKKHDYPAAYQYAAAATSGAAKSNPQVLNEIAWTILDDAGVKTRDYALAMDLAKRADEVTGHTNGMIIDTLARAYFEKGDIDKAIELQKKAIEHTEEEAMKADIEATLKKYEAAKAKK